VIGADEGGSMPLEGWKAITTGKLIAVSAGLVIFFYIVIADRDGFIFLDYANLAFHEAGHAVFGIFGRTLGLYGGTLGQLVLPAVAAMIFWRRREAVSCTLAAVWFFQNFLNIARYMADARMQALPLVGDGTHDWANIFGRWNVLSLDMRIAGFVTIVGWLGMLTAWGWVSWLWYEQKRAGRSPIVSDRR
jgi:hypothetical protein